MCGKCTTVSSRDKIISRHWPFFSVLYPLTHNISHILIWILKTTYHILRYKETPSFSSASASVSGPVSGPEVGRDL